MIVKSNAAGDRESWIDKGFLTITGFLVLVAPLAIDLRCYDPAVLKEVLLIWGVIALLALQLIEWFKRGEIKILKAPYFLPLLLFFSLIFILTTLAQYQVRAWLEFYRVAWWGVLFLVISNRGWSAERHLRWLVAPWSIAAIVVAAYGIAQFMGWDFIKLRLVGGHFRVRATLGHPNFYAAYLTLSFFVLLALSTVLRSRRWRLIVGWVVLPVIGIGLLVSLSRGGILGFTGGLLIVVLYLGNKLLNRLKQWRLPWYVWGVSFVLGVSIIVLLGLMVAPQLAQRIPDEEVARLSSRQNVSNLARITMWTTAVKMMAQKPVLGWGPGAFQVVFPEYQVKNQTVQEYMIGKTLRHAHNEFLELGVDLGIVGLGFFGWFLTAFALVVRRSLLCESQHSAFVTIALSAAIVGILLHNLVDVNLRILTPAFFWWLTLGLTAGRLAARKGSPETLKLTAGKRPLLVRLLLGCIMLSLFPFAIRASADYRANLLLRQGLDALSYHNYAGAISGLDRAVELAPHDDFILYQSAYSYSLQGQWQEVAARLEQVARINPNYGHINFNLAYTYAMSGNLEAGLKAGLRELALHPSYTKAHYVMGWIYYDLHNYQAARNHLNTYLLSRSSDANALNYLGTIEAIEGNPARALTIFKEAIEHDPAAIEARYNAARLLARTGNYPDAAHYLAEALLLDHEGWVAASSREFLGQFIADCSRKQVDLKLVSILEGLVTFWDQSYSASIQNLETANEQSPLNEHGRLFLAWAYEKQGRITEAKLQYAQLLEENPRYWPCLTSYSQFCRAHCSEDTRRQLEEIATALTPRVPLFGNFNNLIHLAGIDASTELTVTNNELPVTIFWDARGQSPDSLLPFFYIESEHGSHFWDDCQHSPNVLTLNQYVTGSKIKQEIVVHIPSTAKNGRYRLFLGVWNRAMLDQARVSDANQALVPLDLGLEENPELRDLLSLLNFTVARL